MNDAYTDLVNLCTGILECLDHNDPWPKRTRQGVADKLRAALAKIDEPPAVAPPPPDDIPVWLRAERERDAIEQKPPPEGWGLLPVEEWPV